MSSVLCRTPNGAQRAVLGSEDGLGIWQAIILALTAAPSRV